MRGQAYLINMSGLRQRRFNGCVLPLNADGVQNAQSPMQKPGLPKPQLSFPLLFSLFFRKHINADDNKAYTQYAYGYSPENMEVLKEITCEPHKEYSLADVCYGLSDKFNFFSMGFHTKKIYHSPKVMSRFICAAGRHLRLSGRIRQGNLGDLAEMMPLAAGVMKVPGGFSTRPDLLNAGAKGDVSVLPPVRIADKIETSPFARPEPGDVVVIDENGGIRRSFEPNSTKVTGIITTNPAQILRDNLENAAAGTVIGKALEKLEADEGEIEVVVMLR